MKHNKPLILFGVIIILAFILGFDWMKNRAFEKSASSPSSLFQFGAEEVALMTLMKGEKTITITKKQDTWILNDDAFMVADMTQVTEMLQVSKLLGGEVVSTNPEKQNFYEVNAEKGLQVKLHNASNQLMAYFFLGSPGPIAGTGYLRFHDSNEVRLVSTDFRLVYDKEVNDLRDKTILKIDVTQTKEIVLQEGKSKIIIKKEKEEWRVEGLPQEKIDIATVDRLNATLASLSATDFVQKQTLKELGLDPELFRVTFKSENQSYTLLFGKTEKNNVYAKRADLEQIYLVNKTLYESDIHLKLSDLQKEE